MDFIIGLIAVIIFLNIIFGGSSSPSTSSSTASAASQPTETADMFQMNMAAEEDATPEA